jgi:hypothetical protein
MKKVFTFAFAVLLVFGLLGMAACGGDGNSSGSKDKALALGTTATVGDWEITVTGYQADATALVLDTNDFNDEPGEGQQYAIVSLEATFNGDEASSLWLDTTTQLIGPSGAAFDAAGVVVPDDIFSAGSAEPGGSVSGNAVFLIDSDQADDAVLKVTALWIFDTDEGKEAVFALK